MPTFLRHGKSECSTTSNFQGGHQNGTADKVDETGEGGKKQQQEAAPQNERQTKQQERGQEENQWENCKRHVA